MVLWERNPPCFSPSTYLTVLNPLWHGGKSPAVPSMPASPLSSLGITLEYIQHEKQKRMHGLSLILCLFWDRVRSGSFSLLVREAADVVVVVVIAICRWETSGWLCLC